MLKEIRCTKFIETPLVFEKGLNAILGDNYSTNSIGKSTLLMILDFVFGGNSFLEKDSGAVKELGDLRFDFQFQFGNKSFFYSRSTESSGIIMVCDKDFNVTNEIGIDSYTAKLKELYKLKSEATFRATLGPYSRIWGKDNYDVDKPILNFKKESEHSSIENFIKLFGLYKEIASTLNLIKSKEEAKKILAGMFKQKIVPNVTKADFSKNEKEIERINNEIKAVQDNLLKFTLNIEELSSKEVIDLKTQKHRLIAAQSIVLTKIRRLELNLSRTGTKSKYYSKLSEFFENPNEEKIKEIESFHDNISKILQRELEATKEVLDRENSEFNAQIAEIDIKIEALLSNVNSPKFIVEKLYDLTIESNKLKERNNLYSQKEDVIEEVKSLNIGLDDTFLRILGDIEEKVNNELIRINREIHTEKKKIPRIKLDRRGYSYDHSSNTGTGKSFSDLIEFDLAIFSLTSLPILIHDSILFKNIEDKAIDRIVEQYNFFEKQIFIALDGINKFSNISQKTLKDKCVLQLSEKRKLFNRDWR